MKKLQGKLRLETVSQKLRKRTRIYVKLYLNRIYIGCVWFTFGGGYNAFGYKIGSPLKIACFAGKKNMMQSFIKEFKKRHVKSEEI